MKLSDIYSNMENDDILESNLLLEKIQLQQKYLTNLMNDMGRELNIRFCIKSISYNFESSKPNR